MDIKKIDIGHRWCGGAHAPSPSTLPEPAMCHGVRSGSPGWQWHHQNKRSLFILFISLFSFLYIIKAFFLSFLFLFFFPSLGSVDFILILVPCQIRDYGPFD